LIQGKESPLTCKKREKIRGFGVCAGGNGKTGGGGGSLSKDCRLSPPGPAGHPPRQRGAFFGPMWASAPTAQQPRGPLMQRGLSAKLTGGLSDAQRLQPLRPRCARPPPLTQGRLWCGAATTISGHCEPVRRLAWQSVFPLPQHFPTEKAPCPVGHGAFKLFISRCRCGSASGPRRCSAAARGPCGRRAHPGTRRRPS